MKKSTKAEAKIAYGYFSLINNAASLFGYSIGSFFTGDHKPHRSAGAAATFSNRRANAMIKEGKAELAEARREEQ